MLITDEIVAAAIKAAGCVVAATKREGGGRSQYFASEDGRLIGIMAGATIKEIRNQS